MSSTSKSPAPGLKDLTVRGLATIPFLAPSCSNWALNHALSRIYQVAGGSEDSGDTSKSVLTTEQRMEFFLSNEFATYIACERACGSELFWLKDVDGTQAAGDVFTFFFKWRADNNKFLPEQLEVIANFLRGKYKELGIESTSYTPYDVLRLWESKEKGGVGIGMLDFWAGVYWPSQIGLTKEQKLSQVAEFAPLYAEKIFPGVREENLLLESLGVHVVIVSNGDQELAFAIAPFLGVKVENTVGSHLEYDERGIAKGVNHSYEVNGKDWLVRPQPGKPLSFHYWLYMNRERFGWKNLTIRKVKILGCDGDSASTDGGMMMLMMQSVIGNFMIKTPGDPEVRIQNFHAMASKYGWTRGQFFTLVQKAGQSGKLPDLDKRGSIS